MRCQIRSGWVVTLAVPGVTTLPPDHDVLHHRGASSVGRASDVHNPKTRVRVPYSAPRGEGGHVAMLPPSPRHSIIMIEADLLRGRFSSLSQIEVSHG